MKLILGLLALSLAILSGGAALGNCAFCHAEVRFDETMALCFEEYAQSQVASVATEIAVVNLVGCRDNNATRSGLPTGAGADLVDASFVIPAQSLKCLAELVGARFRPMSEVTAFPVSSDCQ